MVHYIGIDIGTTHAKALLTDGSAKTIHQDKRGYPSMQPQVGYHEQDPAQILEAVKSLIDGMMTAVRSSTAGPSTSTSISFSSAMHSLIAVDAKGEALHPMMTWADTRSTAISASLKATDAGNDIYQHTGVPIHPMSPLCKIAWLREQEPQIFASTHKFISIKEYVWFHLLGEFKIDHAIASATGLLDLAKRIWYQPSLQFAGIDAGRLSNPVSVNYSVIQDGTRYMIGASDGSLANLGSGATGPGDAALTIGTSGAVRVLRSTPFEDPKQRLFSYIADDKTYLIGGAINNGGVILQWFMDCFCPGEQGDDALGHRLEEAGKLSPGSERLVFLPYLLGERAPVWDARARGVFFGINPLHTRIHFLRAVVEGICFSLRSIVDAMEEQGQRIDRVHVSGGFTASEAWLKILCDVLQKELLMGEDADASVLGAVLLAVRADDATATKAAPQHNLHHVDVAGGNATPRTWTPDKATSSGYERNYAIFSRLYPKLKDEFAALGE